MHYKRLTIAFSLMLGFSFALVACGDIPSPATLVPTTTVPTIAVPTAVLTTAPPTIIRQPTTQSITVPTTNAVAPTTARVTTVPTTTTTPASSATTTIATNASVSGLGSELIGQLIAVDGTDVRVRSVKSFTQLNGSSKTFTPKGIFLVVVMDVANLGKKPAGLGLINLKDNQGKEYTDLNALDTIEALAAMPEFK